MDGSSGWRTYLFICQWSGYCPQSGSDSGNGGSGGSGGTGGSGGSGGNVGNGETGEMVVLVVLAAMVVLVVLVVWWYWWYCGTGGNNYLTGEMGAAMATRQHMYKMEVRPLVMSGYPLILLV